MSAYEHLLHPTAKKSVSEEQQTPWHAIRWFVDPLRYVLSRGLTCWHRSMSRPFTRDGETYRVCLRCGVHRRFDLDAWKTKGAYYCDKEVRRHCEEGSSSGAAVSRRGKLRLIA